MKGSPFHIQQKTAAWERPVIFENGIEREYPRRAAISSFGASGTNVHLILEEHTQNVAEQSKSASRSFLIPVSARTQKQLDDMLGNLVQHMERAAPSGTPVEPLDVACTLQVGRGEC